ncbi:chromosome-associated kinesin KIF4A isoform X2 [Periplaneta americana]
MSESAVTVQVALRIRPLVETEIARGCQQCLDTVPNEPQVQVRGTDRAFTYNFVFGPKDDQLCIYNSAVKDLVSRLFKGYNVTVLAYGQTGSGKTYSMGTTFTGDENMGVIPRSISDIFEKVKEMENWEFKITVSFMELYQEQLFDLLATNKCVVDIREDGKGIRIPGLTEVPVTCPEDTTRCLLQGSACRATGATAMNAQSSRSHAIFTITIHQQKRNMEENTSMTAKFHLVDLAGSERSKKTKATGERFREGVNINRGLLALGNVISALGDEGHQKSYISYRDSKLTRLLQDSLGGNSITLMIACVSPADYNLEETLSTLRYADRARRIRNKPIVNQDPRLAEIAKLKQQNQELRLELLARGGSGDCPAEHKRLEDDVANLVTKNRKLTEELNNALSASTNLFERALLAEVARDRMKVKLCELQAEYGQAMDSLSQTVDQENCPATFLEQLKNLRDLQLKIQELQAEQKRSSDEILNHELSSAVAPQQEEMENNDDSYENVPPAHEDIDEHHQTHTLRQVERTKELQELNQKLALKEELASKLMANINHMSSIRGDHEGNLKELQEQILVLQKEKDELMQALQTAQNHNTTKLSEQRRKRLQELEQKISVLSKKITEQEKIIKMKERNDEKINQLNSEIQGMKQAKVKMIRQMRSENERFRTWKQQREKELIKLRVQDRRRQNELARMERLHTKQQNVLKRKVEEAVAVNKRLKDALAVQKSVQDRRLQQHGTAAKVQLWIDQELEVLISTVAAERTLEQLLEDRATLHEQLELLKARLEQDDGSPTDRLTMDQDIKQLNEDLELRNAQIADLQQKILDSDQENKSKTRWDTVQSMADAKCALKHLFDLTAELKREVSNKESKYEDLEAAYQKAVSKLALCEQQLKEHAQMHQQQLLSIEKEHEEKVFVLLRQLQGSENRETDDSQLEERLQIQSQELEKMDFLRRELEEKTSELEKYKSRLAPKQKNRKNETIIISSPSKMLEKEKPFYYEYDAHYSSSEDDIDDVNVDPDWRKTPIFKKLQRLKSDRFSVRPEQERAVKRNSDGHAKCSCKGTCKTKQCGCRKIGSTCSKECKCDHNSCQNQDETSRTLFADSSSESVSDENRDPNEENFKRPRAMSAIEEEGLSRTSRIVKKTGKYFA